MKQAPARIHADVDQPDKIVYGLTARQLAILAVAAAVAYGRRRGSPSRRNARRAQR